MPHNDLSVTTPNDPTQRWRDGYVTVLQEAGAKEKTIPYCIGWVRRFFSRFPGRRRREMGRAEIETFLSEAAAHPGISKWHFQQARDALELHYAKYRGIALEPREDVPAAAHQTVPLHADAHIQSACVTYTKPEAVVKDAGTLNFQRTSGRHGPFDRLTTGGVARATGG